MNELCNRNPPGTSRSYICWQKPFLEEGWCILQVGLPGCSSGRIWHGPELARLRAAALQRGSLHSLPYFAFFLFDWLAES
jgi:hypothetical protein